MSSPTPTPSVLFQLFCRNNHLSPSRLWTWCVCSCWMCVRMWTFAKWTASVLCVCASSPGDTSHLVTTGDSHLLRVVQGFLGMGNMSTTCNAITVNAWMHTHAHTLILWGTNWVEMLNYLQGAELDIPEVIHSYSFKALWAFFPQGPESLAAPLLTHIQKHTFCPATSHHATTSCVKCILS